MECILHYSDLHGKLPQIPKKRRNDDTILVLSGDIADNYPEDTFVPGYMSNGVFTPSNWNMWNFRMIDKILEAELQSGWIQTVLIPHLVDNKIKLDNVIILKGNHDFCSFEKFFTNGLDIGVKHVTIKGIKFGMFTGVLPFTGEWNDEVDDSIIGERIKEIDQDIDILVTHVPTYGIRDGGGNFEKLGSPSLYNAIFGIQGITPYFHKIRYHLFGHSHGNHGVDKHEIDGRVVRFVNAACQRMVIDIDLDKW